VTATELARKVRSVELRARRTVGELVSGAYHSAFKGQGMEFQEVREYVPGDDTRAIDWNVTARVGRPYIKRYSEERDQTVMLVLDVSRSQSFGAASAWKRDIAAEILAILAFAAAYNKDEAGLILFTGEVELYVPPGGGETHVLRLIRDVLAFQPRSPGTNLAGALEFLTKVRRRRSLVFVISDFQDGGFARQLRLAGRRHDVIALSVYDAREQSLPDCGLLECEDAETGERWLLDTSYAAMRRAYEAAANERAAALRETFRAAGVDHLRIEAGSDYVRRLIAFLRVHGKRD
jgi:uncharacterized protein (DUF58 family)